MGNISLTKTWVDAEVLNASDLNTNFTDVTDVVNGNIETVNIADGAITADKIATSAVTTAKISNPYKLCAHRSTPQTISSSSTWTTVRLNAEYGDPNNNFDTSTFTYTVPVTGYYLITGQIRMGGAKMVAIARILTTTRNIEGAATDNAAYTDDYSDVTDIVQLTAGQTVNLQVYHTFGAPASMTSARLSIHLLSV